MGFIAHHAVLVTIGGYAIDEPTKYGMPDLDAFRESLPEHFRPLVIGPVRLVANDTYAAVFLPDGSKEGWDASDTGDEARTRFVDLFAWAFSDGSSPYDVVTIRFGGDEPDDAWLTQPYWSRRRSWA